MNKGSIYRFKANETFSLRQGWLQKGLNIIAEHGGEYKASEEDMIEDFGIGSNMCKALKYYMSALGVVKRKSNILSLTSFGKCLYSNDRFLENIFSISLLHYKMCTPVSLFNPSQSKTDSIVYRSFFNTPLALKEEVSKSEIKECVLSYINLSDEDVNIASLENDVSVFVQSYIPVINAPPEDWGNTSVFSALNLVQKNQGKRDSYKKVPASFEIIKSESVYYALKMTSVFDNHNKTCNIEDIKQVEGGPYKIFNLSEPLLLFYLEDLEKKKYISLTRTAGLNVVEDKMLFNNEEDLLESLYNNVKKEGGYNV